MVSGTASDLASLLVLAMKIGSKGKLQSQAIAIGLHGHSRPPLLLISSLSATSSFLALRSSRPLLWYSLFDVLLGLIADPWFFPFAFPKLWFFLMA
jgi:hypothetical protein